MGLAVAALAPEEQVANHRDILPGSDLVAAGRAGGRGAGECDGFVRLSVTFRYLEELLALTAPFLVHHLGQAEDDDVEEAAHAEGDEKDG